ncbi:MAG: hypothetical protein H7306_10165 [Bacteriovorax sp.]|nr:hypothetical protein [Rhizobacter sp.]
MQVLFKSRDPHADELQDVAQRRMRFVFRRFDWLIPKATVWLSDVNGPRGGIDKRCQVEIGAALTTGGCANAPSR